GEPGDAHRPRELVEQRAPRHADVPLSSGPEVQDLLWRVTRKNTTRRDRRHPVHETCTRTTACRTWLKSRGGGDPRCFSLVLETWEVVSCYPRHSRQSPDYQEVSHALVIPSAATPFLAPHPGGHALGRRRAPAGRKALAGARPRRSAGDARLRHEHDRAALH